MRRMTEAAILAVILVLSLGACARAVDVSAPQVEIPAAQLTPTPLPSATVVWFPPTPTSPPPVMATIPPTPEMRPGVAELLFMENFNDPTAWNGLASTNAGSMTLEDGQLTIAVRQAKTRLAAIHEAPVPSDAYIEVTARTNLCSGADEYGLIFRMNSNARMFRYALSCDGQVQVARLADGAVTYPRAWTPSGDVPTGAPGVTRLGVWLNGREMRFFLNNAFQFSVRDPSVMNGSLGVFARSAAETPLSVSFQDLVVFALESAE